MLMIPLPISDVLRLTPQVWSDPRGCFYESFNQREFQAHSSVAWPFVQDNHSVSTQGVIRGLHYQLPPKAQGKLVRAVVGEIFDVAVDIRRSSPTFGQWVGEILSADNQHQLWIPPGFAHGFMALSARAEVLYKTTDYWDSGCERTISWDDPAIAIVWPPCASAPLLSSKDQQALLLEQVEVFA